MFSGCVGPFTEMAIAWERLGNELHMTIECVLLCVRIVITSGADIEPICDSFHHCTSKRFFPLISLDNRVLLRKVGLLS